MGQPKFNRRHYDTPSHPWQGERIKAENEVKSKYGLKNKTEIWKAQTILRDVRGQARALIARTRNPADEQAVTESRLLIARLQRSGYLGDNATLNEVLGLDLERVLNRRLQTQVYLKGLARTPKQARQFVSHGNIKIGDRRVTVPSYVVRRGEEEQIMIDPTAAIADENHPVRPKAQGFETPAPSLAEAPAPAGATGPGGSA
ncbi:MAG: 30S ribosomal protein S4 [bacterium]